MKPVCKQCVHVHAHAKSDPRHRWMCVKRPLKAEYDPVTGEDLADPPYQFCRFLNLRTHPCELFEAGPNVFSPKEVVNANSQA
jgi:hypothetical protein